MDDLTAIRDFRAERDGEPPEARDRVRRALEARMDAATAEARTFGEAVAGSHPPLDATSRRRGFFARRRRALAFAGAIAAAAIVAGALVLGSGPTAQRASAAEILHQAAAAASDARPSSVPGPGQFYFRAEQRLEVMGWISPVPGPDSMTGTASTGAPMPYPNAHNALVTTKVESWTGDDGSGRNREELGELKFWEKAEEAKWKRAGSPVPPPWNPEYRKRYPDPSDDTLMANSHVVDRKNPGFGQSFHFPDTSKLPTDPKALRQAIEADAIEVTGFNLVKPSKGAKRLDAQQTKEQLVNILFEGEATPRLQAAIFDALAELPGIKVTPATDSLGRQGDMISYAVRDGIRAEFLFDAETSDLLATRATLVHPAGSESFKRLPAGTTVNERDYLEAGVVDSIHQRPGGGMPGGAAAKGS
jgi:hypothetical protein